MRYYTIIILTVLITAMPRLALPQSNNPERSFRTINGNIGFTGIFHDSVVIAKSYKLLAMIDHENTKLNFTLDLTTIDTGIDSLNRIFHSISPPTMKLDGKMELDYLITQNHPTLNFNINGFLSLNGIKRYKTYHATLMHYPQDLDIACQLTINFTLNLDDFGLADHFEGWNNELHVEIQQAILYNDTK